MSDGQFRAMLAAALLVVITALAGLQSLPGEVWEAAEAAGAHPNQRLPSFSERLMEAGSVQALATASPDGWVAVGPGIDYQLFPLPDPNNVHVARMARTNPDLFLESSIAQGRLTGGLERVSGMYARYEGAINYWGSTWGGTDDVLVAINGSFFDANGTPDRGVIHSGWYAKRFTDNENGSGFVWKLDGTLFVGECVSHSPTKQVITYLNTGNTNKFQGINRPRGADELVIYTPQYDASTQTSGGLEVLVEMLRPMLVLPQPSMALGTVRAMRDQQGDSALPFDHIILSATGTMRTKLLANLQVGDVIGISNSITSLQDGDCSTPAPMDWTKAYAAVGGSYYFLENGVINSFSDPGATQRNPRTAIAFDATYVYFIVVDGRDPGVSQGMTIGELALFVRDTLGADYAINQDGGGSSTMVIDGVVVNTPSDLSPAPCTDFAFLPLITHSSSADFTPTTSPDESPLKPLQCYAHTERAVANGMMMVLNVPVSVSGAFSAGQDVTAPAGAAVYLGPGDNYAILGSAPGGSIGTVQPNGAGLDGVFAKGAYWWLVDFGSLEGWVAESALAAAP